MEREEEFREITIEQIKKLKIKVNGLYVVVLVLIVLFVWLSSLVIPHINFLK